MFNREKLSITHQELADDLTQFGLALSESVSTKAERCRFGIRKLLFIHRSQAQEADAECSNTKIGL